MINLNKELPSVSVLMSCFNGSRWIDKAISSVLDQSFSINEFVIVDDGSTDDSLEVILKWVEVDKRIKVIKKNNTGLADSLNVGIRSCSSKWIARIDVDDIWHKNRIETQIEVLLKDKNLEFIAGSMIEIDDNGNDIKKYQYPKNHKMLRHNLLSLKKFPPHSSVLFKKSLAMQLGLYRGVIKRAEDHDLWLRMSEVTRMYCCNESITYIRKHEDQISNESNGRTQQRDAFIGICCGYARLLGIKEPANYSDNDFNEFKIKVDKIFDHYYFYEFYPTTQVIKNLLKGKVDSSSGLNLIHFIYQPYQYLFRRSYLKRISLNILTKIKEK